MKCKIAPNKSSLTKSSRVVKNSLNTCKVTSTLTKPFKLKLKTSMESTQRSKIIKLKKKSKVNEAVGVSLIEKPTKLDEHLEKSSNDSNIRCCCCCSSSLCSKQKCKDEDESIIRQPINHGTTNVRQIFQCVHNGTPEIKDIILNECNIIYECRSCKSLFRSLSNLLSHKRQYCRDHLCEKMILFDETLINFEENDGTVEPYFKNVDSENLISQNSLNESNLKEKNEKIETKKATETLLEPKLISKAISAKRNYLESCLKKIKNDKRKQKKEQVNFKLIKISSNPNAVYQKVIPINAQCTQVKNDSNFIQESQTIGDKITDLKDDKEMTAINSEINSIGNSNQSFQEDYFDQLKTLKSPTHKSDENFLENSKSKSGQSEKVFQPVSMVTCHLCNSKFSSKKTLNVHLQTIHSMTRLVYPCPFCYLTFKQLFNATRHMIQVHRKGKTQVKFLREAVRRRAYPEIKSEDSLEDEEEGMENFNEFEGDDEIDFDFEKLKEEEIDSKIVKEESQQSLKNLNDSSSLLKQIENDDNHENDQDLKSSLKNDCNQSLVENVNSIKVGSEEERKEKRKRLSRTIYSCVYECGRYYVKLDSKVSHEKKCPQKSTQK